MADGFERAQAAYDAQLPPDSDDIDSFEFERISNAIAECKEGLKDCDPEHRSSYIKDIRDLENELDDLKAGY